MLEGGPQHNESQEGVPSPVLEVGENDLEEREAGMEALNDAVAGYVLSRAEEGDPVTNVTEAEVGAVLRGLVENYDLLSEDAQAILGAQVKQALQESILN
jgi:hypothetical protein